MLYYKIKPICDNVRIWDKSGKYKSCVVGNELYTQKELEKLLKNTKYYNNYTPLAFRFPFQKIKFFGLLVVGLKY